MRFKRGLVAAVFAGLGLVMGIAQAQDMTFFRIGTGGAGGTYYPIGGLIANAISNPPGSRACDKGGSCGVPGLVAIAVSTNASVANMNAIHAGQLDAVSQRFHVFDVIAVDGGKSSFELAPFFAECFLVQDGSRR